MVKPSRRRWIPGLALAALLGAAAACNGPSQSAPPAEILVEGRRLVVRGAPLQLRAPVAAWTAALGSTPRYVDRAGGIYVWDDAGIAGFATYLAPASDPHVAAAWIVFAERDVDFWPRHPYAGRVRVAPPGAGAGSGMLDRDTTVESLDRRSFPRYPELNDDVRVRFSAAGARTLEACIVHSDPDVAGMPGSGPTGP